MPDTDTTTADTTTEPDPDAKVDNPQQLDDLDGTDTTEDQSDADPADKAGAEAAKYRRRLRETEAERDNLLARVEHLQRGEIERLITGKLTDPADIWRDGAQLADLLDDDGDIDPDKVTTLLDDLVKAHPHWATQDTRTPRLSNPVSGASKPQPARRDSFTKAFSPKER